LVLFPLLQKSSQTPKPWVPLLLCKTVGFYKKMDCKKTEILKFSSIFSFIECTSSKKACSPLAIHISNLVMTFKSVNSIISKEKWKRARKHKNKVLRKFKKCSNIVFIIHHMKFFMDVIKNHLENRDHFFFMINKNQNQMIFQKSDRNFILLNLSFFLIKILYF